MPDTELPDTSRMRPWQEIAREMTHETDPLKILALSQELSAAFDVAQTPEGIEDAPRTHDCPSE